MKGLAISYIDTSILVAALDEKDRRYDKARAILEESGRVKVISELVVTELASVVARRSDIVSSIGQILGLGPEEVMLAIILYVVKRFGLKLHTVERGTKIPTLGTMNAPLYETVKLAPTTRLRTLDLIHVAYVKLMVETGLPLGAFITADLEYERAREFLKDTLGVELLIID